MNNIIGKQVVKCYSDLLSISNNTIEEIIVQS